jgi:PadR family transcriptional regulator, regulatory protein PadR
MAESHAWSGLGIDTFASSRGDLPETRALYMLLSITEGERLTKSTELLQGTLDLLILKVLILEPMHGWAIAQRIRLLSKDVLRVNQGALYPALHRLEHEAWIKAEWGESENNRRAKYYSLTKAGRKRLEAEEQSWERLSTAVQVVLKAV